MTEDKRCRDAIREEDEREEDKMGIKEGLPVGTRMGEGKTRPPFLADDGFCTPDRRTAAQHTYRASRALQLSSELSNDLNTRTVCTVCAPAKCLRAVTSAQNTTPSRVAWIQR